MKIFSIVTGYLAKRRKASTPKHEEVDKRNCRVCLGGHKAIEGVHYNRIHAYAPVPTWTTIKLQLALTSRHRLQLQASDCVAVYLQADLKDPLYVYPPILTGTERTVAGAWPRSEQNTEAEQSTLRMAPIWQDMGR